MPGYDDEVNQRYMSKSSTQPAEQCVDPGSGTDQGDLGDWAGGYEIVQDAGGYAAPAAGALATDPDRNPSASWWSDSSAAMDHREPERCLDTPSGAPQGGFFSSDHNTNETAWDVVGVIPGLGNVVSAANAVGDAYGVVAADNAEERGQAMRDLAQDALGAIPIVGNVIGAGRVVYDAFAGNDCAQDALDRFMGGKEKQSPEAYQDDHPPVVPAIRGPAPNQSKDEPNQCGPDEEP